jgi:signal transduction histidine kinase
MQGRITCTSVLNEGTTFYIHLPKTKSNWYHEEDPTHWR